MVYLVLTRAGFEQVRPRMHRGDIVWTGRSVLSSGEEEALREEGIDLTVFSHDIDQADTGAAAGWTYTVAQHHPKQPIWVERMDDVLEERKRHRSLRIWIYAVLLAVSTALAGVYFGPFFVEVARWVAHML